MTLFWKTGIRIIISIKPTTMAGIRAPMNITGRGGRLSIASRGSISLTSATMAKVRAGV